jgi:beta-glucanase (GH16 family)
MNRLLIMLAVCVPLCAADWKLVWSDEFNGKGLPDASKWTYEEGFIANREAQYYTKGRLDNIRQENGSLIIEARREKWPNASFREGSTRYREQRRDAEYTSARIKTQGKAEWRYGRFEIRAKLPTGRGTWPAIWMLGTNTDKVGWPRGGEIDIMENVGYDPDVIHANVHTQAYNHVKKTNKGAKISVEKPWQDFHVYAVEWTPAQMDFFVDDRKYFTFQNEKTGEATWPFDQPFYLILNVAVGGTWGGTKGVDDGIFPQRMEVDYVRVYEKP